MNFSNPHIFATKYPIVFEKGANQLGTSRNKNNKITKIKLQGNKVTIKVEDQLGDPQISLDILILIK
jgi:hypothetical protein